MNPNSTSGPISFGLSTYYQINQELYLADILDPNVIYSRSNGNLKLISFAPSSYKANDNCKIDLYMIADISLNSNITLVLNFSNSFQLGSAINASISLFEATYQTYLNTVFSPASLELTNLPSIPSNNVFTLHLSNVILPRSVGNNGIINISGYNATYSLTNMIMPATADIQPKLPNQIEIERIIIGEQRTDSMLPIIFRISLSSPFIPFSDYLEFTYPPQVHWDTSKSYFSSQGSPIPYFVASYSQNRTVRVTLKTSIGSKESFEISLLIISNNSMQLGAFTISFYDQENRIIAQSPAIYPMSWNSPIGFQNVMLLLSNLRVSNLTNCTLKVPISLQVPMGGTLVINFPSELQTASGVCNATSNGEFLNCTSMKNGIFVVSSDSSPLLASIPLEILITNVSTPSISGPIILHFDFETSSAEGEHSLQKGGQYYNITFEEGPTNFVVSTAYSGSSHWFPILTIYCLTVAILALLHRAFMKKYYALPLIISYWSIAEFPSLGYSIYYFTKLELPENSEYDFPTIVIVVVVIILMIGITAHIRSLLAFKKNVNSNATITRVGTLKCFWICSPNYKLLWLYFRESRVKTHWRMRDECHILIHGGTKLLRDLLINITWLSICGVFAFSKAIIDAVYHRNGYYFLFETAAFYFISAILILFYYCRLKGQRQDAYATSKNVSEEQQKNNNIPQSQRDNELSQNQRSGAQPEVEIPRPLNGSGTLLVVNEFDIIS